MDKESKRWDFFAKHYNKEVFYLPKYPRIREKVLRHVRAGKVLDFGCGPTGDMLNSLQKDGNVAWGVDISPAMVEKAKKNFSGTVICADGRKLSFEDNFFDSVVSVNSILPPEREDVQLMFKEIYRVLKSGGKLIAFLVSYDYVKKRLRNGLTNLKIDEENYRVWDTGGWQCFHTKEALERLMKDVGFLKWNIELELFDEKQELEDLRKIYGIDFTDCPPEEHFLIAVK